VTEREDAAIAPDQIDRQREQRIAGVFAEQRHEVGRQVQGRRWRRHEIEGGHDHRQRRDHDHERHRAAVERTDEEVRTHRQASTARPLSANMPRGRF
jgi:hypothetical protein